MAGAGLVLKALSLTGMAPGLGRPKWLGLLGRLYSW